MIDHFIPDKYSDLKLLIYDDDLFFIQNVRNGQSYGGIYVEATCGGADFPDLADDGYGETEEIENQFLGKKPKKTILITKKEPKQMNGYRINFKKMI